MVPTLYITVFFFNLLGLLLQHVEVPRLGVQSELQLLAYATATAMPELSHGCDLHHSLWQRRILNPLSAARDRTHNLMVPSWIRFCCTTKGTPALCFTFLLSHGPLISLSVETDSEKFNQRDFWSPNCGSVVTNLASIHEDAASFSGLMIQHCPEL